MGPEGLSTKRRVSMLGAFYLCGKASWMLNGTFVHSFFAGCGGTLLGNEGILANPGFPDSYPNNTHCEWTIVAPSGRPLSVGFPFLSIDSPGGCDQNYLILFNGPDANSPPFGPFCGIVSKQTSYFTFPHVKFHM
jgi:hypothetical protein